MPTLRSPSYNFKAIHTKGPWLAGGRIYFSSNFPVQGGAFSVDILLFEGIEKMRSPQYSTSEMKLQPLEATCVHACASVHVCLVLCVPC